MQIRILSEVYIAGERRKPGSVIDLSGPSARELLAKGKAEKVVEKIAQKAKPDAGDK